MKTASILIASLFATIAHAGQQFSFSDPIPNADYPGPASFSNYMFVTNTLLQGNQNTTATFSNTYSGNVNLTVDSFSSTGAYLGSTTSQAKYFLSTDGSRTNGGTFGGTKGPDGYATGGGSVIFVDASGSVLLQANFTDSRLTYSPLATTKVATTESLSAAASGLSFAGSLFTTTETSNPNAGFGLVNRFTQGTNTNLAHHTGVFYASVGTIGTVSSPVPEPSSWAALSAGAIVLLRRRRRA